MTNKTESIILGGGCFWCLEASYQLIRGVTKVAPGYAGGDDASPTYEKVCSGRTGHAEVVKVEFDPAEINLAQILDIFWTIHDPTTLNRQGYDIGTEYRSLIICDQNQLEIVQSSIEGGKKIWGKNITTELMTEGEFYQAEIEHQDYFAKHPEQAYCQIVINPKLQKLRDQYASLLR